MPTILRINGWRFVIYVNDHPPAHIHVLGPGWSVVINVADQVIVREVVGPCAEHDARKAQALAADHQQVLLAAWEEIHG
ncbi:DUF4160 domain-containing protein [Acidisoma silvae]|uniref:DUF4160 domain-containing protein n=1 Tax=Acidisoma silvae TaxID=2802396 RepID=A0A963YQG2_9PROT|nr:DUF4160 domain-containing protein [Acidisoma silvae]MCB8875231.1 DUF4160 domain-containing protein [Acidisoma silvae]